VRVQLLPGSRYPNWPTEVRAIEQRYTDAPSASLRLLTLPAFVATTRWTSTSPTAQPANPRPAGCSTAASRPKVSGTSSWQHRRDFNRPHEKRRPRFARHGPARRDRCRNDAPHKIIGYPTGITATGLKTRPRSSSKMRSSLASAVEKGALLPALS
jgi:hypothetical protein